MQVYTTAALLETIALLYGFGSTEAPPTLRVCLTFVESSSFRDPSFCDSELQAPPLSIQVESCLLIRLGVGGLQDIQGEGIKDVCTFW